MWVKICGIRDVATARWVADLAPDAIGLNYYKASPRYIDESTASEIVAAMPESIEVVGVFVDHSADEIERICRVTGIETAQLHGDHSTSTIDACRAAGLKVIRAVRLGAAEWPTALTTELDQQTDADDVRYLVDSHVAGAYGGTGKAAPWELLRDHWRPDWPPLILAGGLHPDNVKDAIRTVQPHGVDVASGVECSPGVKDRTKVSHFIEAARGMPPGDSPGAK